MSCTVACPLLLNRGKHGIPPKHALHRGTLTSANLASVLSSQHIRAEASYKLYDTPHTVTSHPKQGIDTSSLP